MAKNDAAIGLRLGVYDPAGDFARVPGVAVEHVFVSWVNADLNQLACICRQAVRRGRDLLVTVEPFSRDDQERCPSETLLHDIAAGGYDGEISAIFSGIRTIETGLLVRWGHEMEGRSGRYPWAGGEHALYIAAYRRFVQLGRELVPKASFLWSPQGEPALAGYYPGDDVVDCTGVSVWAHQRWEMRHHRRERRLAELVGEKYERVSQYGKPVVIAEFGIFGSARYRKAILSDLASLAGRFRLLQAIVYFNAREPHNWPEGLGLPDWRIKPSLLSRSVSPPASEQRT